MSNVLSDFDISQDIKVEFFVPRSSENIFIVGISVLGGSDLLSTGGAFVIGESLIGGTDLLGAYGFAWQAYECSVAKVQTSLGGEVRDSLYFQPRPAEAAITLQNLAIDPTVNPAFRPGTPVRVRIERGDYEFVLFNGFIDRIGVTYDPDNQHIMQLVAYDSFKRFVNSRLALLDTLDEVEFPDGYATPYEVLELLAEQFGTAMNARSEDLPGKIPGTLLQDFIPNTVTYQAIQIGLGIFWVDQATGEFVVIPRPATLDGTGKYVIGNQHDEDLHLCMSDIEVESDIDAVFNSLKVSLESDSATSVLIRNTDSIELYGEFAIDQSLNVTDIDELERWGSAVFNQTTTKLVRSVEMPAVDRTNNLTHAAIFEPGETVNVKYITDKLNINEPYSITKVSHSIDVNNWFTTLELWKEF